MNAETSTSQVSPCGFNRPIVATIVCFSKRNSRSYGTVSVRLCARLDRISGSSGWIVNVTEQPAGASE